MKIIIIDDSKDFLALLRRMLATVIPDVEVTEYDPEQQGKPARDFDWSLYDLLFIDYKIGPSDNGVDWLKEFRRMSFFPARDSYDRGRRRVHCGQRDQERCV